MKQSYPLFETVVIDKEPYLRIAFDDKNEAHKEWLSEHIYCVEVANGSSSHDYPTDLVVEIPIIAFIEAYYVLERYHNLEQIVIESSNGKSVRFSVETFALTHHKRAMTICLT